MACTALSILPWAVTTITDLASDCSASRSSSSIPPTRGFGPIAPRQHQLSQAGAFVLFVLYDQYFFVAHLLMFFACYASFYRFRSLSTKTTTIRGHLPAEQGLEPTELSPGLSRRVGGLVRMVMSI